MKEIQQALISLGPLIAGSIFSLRAKEKGDVFETDSLEFDQSSNTEPVDSSEIVTFGIKEEVDNAFFEYEDSERKRSLHCANDTEPVDSSEIITFGIKEEIDNTSFEYEGSKRKESLHGAKGFPFINTELEATVSEHRATEERESEFDHSSGACTSVNSNEQKKIRNWGRRCTQTDYEKRCIQESNCVKEIRIQPEEEEHVYSDYDSGLNQRPNITKQRDQRLQKPCPSTEYCKDAGESVAVTQAARKSLTLTEYGRGFSESATPDQHRETGNLVKSCTCSQCVNNFDQSANPSLHPLLITGEQQTMCSEREKHLYHPTNLRKGLGRPSGESPYICNECGKCFTLAPTLRRHQLIHTGERPFPCKLCGKSFRRSEALVTHQRLHTGEKPYACTQCGKTFRQRAHLLGHHRMHKGKM